MKTPEEMAEEYCNTKQLSYVERLVITKGFVDGYQAAKDQFADADKVMDTCEHILDMEKMVDVNCSNNSDGWISVKDRLPEIGDHGYSEDVLLLSQVGRMEVSHIEKVKRVVKWRGIEPVIETENGTPIEDFTHWMPLPKPPEE